MSAVQEDVSFIDKILMCICCADSPTSSDIVNNDQFNEQQETNQHANLSSDLHQVSQNYSTPIVQQNFVRNSSTSEIATSRPQVQRNCKRSSFEQYNSVQIPTAAVAPSIARSTINVHHTWNNAQLTPTAAKTPQVAKQDVHNTFEPYNFPIASIAPPIARSARVVIQDVHNTFEPPNFIKPFPTASIAPPIAKQDVHNTFEPHNFPKPFPTASIVPPIARSARNVHNTNNVVHVHPIVAPEIGKPKVHNTLESQNGVPKVYESKVPATLPPASTVGKKLPNLNNQNWSSNDNSKLQQDLKKLDASIKHFKHSKKVVPQALRTKFESPKEFQQCIAIHLGKGACDSHSSSSSLDELDEEYYINRPSTIFTVQQQNCDEYDANVQHAPSAAVGTQGNNAGKQKKKKYYKKKKNTIQTSNNVP